MRYLLPSAIFVVIVLLLAVMPWYRADPRHELILEMYKQLADNIPSCIPADEQMSASEEIHKE